MKSAGDRRSGECQDIHILLHLFDLFLVCDTEALLLVHDQKSQILELYVLRQKAMGPYNDIHDTSLEVMDRFFLFF